MAKHLTDADIANIVEILDSWPLDSKLTWEKLVTAVEDECRFKTTRQTLQKYARIKAAFSDVKALVSGNIPNRHHKAKLPPSLKVAAERLEKMERKVERLESENQRLLEQFQVWLYNAYTHNITIEQLNAPLPKKNEK